MFRNLVNSIKFNIQDALRSWKLTWKDSKWHDLDPFFRICAEIYLSYLLLVFWMKYVILKLM